MPGGKNGIKTKLPTGDYVNADELMLSLATLFAEKRPNWLKRVSKKIRDKFVPRDEEDYLYIFVQVNHLT